jgi:hypothetical protein
MIIWSKLSVFSYWSGGLSFIPEREVSCEREKCSFTENHKPIACCNSCMEDLSNVNTYVW